MFASACIGNCFDGGENIPEKSVGVGRRRTREVEYRHVLVRLLIWLWIHTDEMLGGMEWDGIGVD